MVLDGVRRQRQPDLVLIERLASPQVCRNENRRDSVIADHAQLPFVAVHLLRQESILVSGQRVSSTNSQDEYLTKAEIRAWRGALLFTTAVLRALDEALLAAHRISVKEFDVLITLFNAPSNRLRMTDLAERALLTPSGLSHLVTR